MSRDNTIDDKEARVVWRFDKANVKSDASRRTEWVAPTTSPEAVKKSKNRLYFKKWR